jgi:hypothetical protein
VRVEVEQTLTSHLDGCTGGVQVTLLARGDVLLAVDLSQGRWLGVDETRRQAILLLPPPLPSSPRLDQARTQVLSLTRRGLWHIAPTSEPERAVMEQVLAEAQGAVEQAGSSRDVNQRARSHAERTLATLGNSLGWHLQVQWSGSE